MRVLALTRNASLLVALGSMMREWEVVSVPDVASATQETQASVALIDLGDTTEGVEAANELFRLGQSIPCVVLGDSPDPGTDAIVLVRPFSLEELTNAVRKASASPRLSSRSPVTEAPSPPQPVETSKGPAETASKPTTPPVESEKPQPPAPARSRPLTVVPPEPALTNGGADKPAPPAVEERPAPRTEPAHEPEAARTAAPSAPPAPVAPKVEPRPSGPAVAASAAQTAPVLEDDGGQAAGRWRLRRRPQRGAEAEAEDPLVTRLKAAASSAAGLEQLLEELPFLSDLGSIADGLVAEVESQLRAQVASTYVLREDGYHVVAHRGLSRVESGMIVPPTQPLFSDVTQTGEGILIQPIDLAQGLVAGIGGARTEAMMAVPAIVLGKQVAVVIAGSNRFDQADLERLNALAVEAAPGLAVALAFARLREKL